MQGVNVEMDEYYSDFLAKQMSVRLNDKKSKIIVLQKKLSNAEKEGNDKEVIRLSKRIEAINILSKLPKESFVEKRKGDLQNIIAKKLDEKTCSEWLKTMKLTEQGLKDYIKKCEENGDFSASKVKEKEELELELLHSDVIKEERVEQRVEDEEKAMEEAIKENRTPELKKKDFSNKILPIMAIFGIVFLMIKKF
jgi:hypothetical protein